MQPSRRPRLLIVHPDVHFRWALPRGLREAFDAVAVSTRAQALELLASKSFDALVAAVNPGEDDEGRRLVTEAERRFPRTRRFALSPHAQHSASPLDPDHATWLSTGPLTAARLRNALLASLVAPAVA